MSSIVFVSASTPDADIQFGFVKDKYLWLKPLPDGSLEFYESSKIGWAKILTIPAYALDGHSHPTHGDINFTGTVSADGDAGLTGVKTLGGYKFTFTNGLLTGFEPV